MLSLWFNVGDVSVLSFGLLHLWASSWSCDSSVPPFQASNFGSSSPGKQITTKYQWALNRQQNNVICNVTQQRENLCTIHFFMDLTYSWLTGTNRKSFLKMSTWRVHVFTRWCRLCLWQLGAHKNKDRDARFYGVSRALTYTQTAASTFRYSAPWVGNSQSLPALLKP